MKKKKKGKNTYILYCRVPYKIETVDSGHISMKDFKLFILFYKMYIFMCIHILDY